MSDAGLTVPSLPEYRGIVFDLAVFAVSLVVGRALVAVAHGVVQAAAREDVHAKVAARLFFAILVLIQPLGPMLTRWRFHQRATFDTESGAGCFVF